MPRTVKCPATRPDLVPPSPGRRGDDPIACRPVPRGEMPVMAMVWLWLRADVRRQWRALLGLALLLGLVGGVVLTAAAGARRTDTAYPRLLDLGQCRRKLDVIPGNPDPVHGTSPRSPGCRRSRRCPRPSLYNLALPAAGGVPDTQVQAYASPDDTLGVTIDRVKLLQGRMFRPKAASEAVIDPRVRRHAAPAARRHAAHDRHPVQPEGRRARSRAGLPCLLPGDGHRSLRRPDCARHRHQQRAAGPA